MYQANPNVTRYAYDKGNYKDFKVLWKIFLGKTTLKRPAQLVKCGIYLRSMRAFKNLYQRLKSKLKPIKRNILDHLTKKTKMAKNIRSTAEFGTKYAV